MARDVTLRTTDAALVGDETYELWLKHESDAWFLHSTGDVAVDGSNQQEFLLSALAEDADYSAQFRFKRAGRYRAGWLTSNPDTWPSSSRIDFTTGALEGVDPPILNSAVWSRIDVDSTKVAISIDASDLTKDLKVFRNGVSIHTIAAPHVNPVLWDDPDPTLGESFNYLAKHTVGFLDSAPSNDIDVYTGPPPITGLVQTSAVDNYGTYEIDWDNDGRTYQLQDDYLCTATDWQFEVGGSAGFIAGPHEVNKETTVLPVGATQAIAFHCRMRAKVTTFGTTDYSEWTEALIQMEIDDPDDDTNFNTCP
jgi:hypothetical protein